MNIDNTETLLTDEVEKHIRKLISPLKKEDELKKILKIKLTKKEFKVLSAWANGLISFLMCFSTSSVSSVSVLSMFIYRSLSYLFFSSSITDCIFS